MSKKNEFRTRFTPRLAVGINFDPEEKLTKDSFKEESDINRIMEKYLQTGQLPSLMRRDPTYGDFSDVPTFQEALETVRRAEETFQALPAAVRAECGNDPAVFLERVQDPAWAQKHELALTPQAPPSPASPEPKGGAGAPPKEATPAGAE